MGYFCVTCDRCGAIAPTAPFQRAHEAKLPPDWKREGPQTFCPDCVRRIELERQGQARR
jgi:hypothetical protein